MRKYTFEEVAELLKDINPGDYSYELNCIPEESELRKTEKALLQLGKTAKLRIESQSNILIIHLDPEEYIRRDYQRE